jgi:hypothetical protein
MVYLRQGVEELERLATPGTGVHPNSRSEIDHLWLAHTARQCSREELSGDSAVRYCRSSVMIGEYSRQKD